MRSFLLALCGLFACIQAQWSYSNRIVSQGSVLTLSAEPFYRFSGDQQLRCGESLPLSTQSVASLTLGQIPQLGLLTSAQMYLKDLVQGQYRLSVYDLKGALVARYQFQSTVDHSDFYWPIQQWAHGSYILELNGPLSFRQIFVR